MEYNISTEIARCACEHIQHTGRDPSNVYLGYSELVRLKKFAAEMRCGVTRDDLIKVDRDEVHGLKVFVVNADHHLAVS